MKRLVSGLALALVTTGAVMAQTPTVPQTTPFKCPPGMAGKDAVEWRGISLTYDSTSYVHRAFIRYPPGDRCGQEPPLEGLADDNRIIIEPKYAAVSTFAKTIAVARRTDGAHVFIDLATKAERPFPYMRFLRTGDIGAFGIVSDDPATQTSTIEMLSPETGEPIARFERIIGVLSIENVKTEDSRSRAVPLRQRQPDGSERVIWVNAWGVVNRETSPVTELRSGYNRELVEILGPSPFPKLWPEMFTPLQSSGSRWSMSEEILGFARHPLDSSEFVTFVNKDGKALIYTGATPFFRYTDNRLNWRTDPRPEFYFEDMAVVTPAQQPVDEYKAERFLVVRTPGAAGWKPLRMELPDPDYVRPSPQQALDEAIVAYNARMAAGGAEQLEARRAAERAASAKFQAEWEARQAAEAARYDALLIKAANPNTKLAIDEMNFVFDHEAATFKTGLRHAAPDVWAAEYGRRLSADLRKRGTPIQADIRDAERKAREAGTAALVAFREGVSDLDPQSKVMLCDAGRKEYCWQPPPAAAAAYSGSGYAPNVSGDIASSLDAFKAREAAINASNCARASLGASIGCNQ